MKIEINKLKECGFSKNIYSVEPTYDLVDSINANGVIQPIWITKDNMIIAGHRRVNACKQLDIKTIDSEVKDYSDLLVIESNRYREKTWEEKLSEAEALAKILRPKAEEREKAGKKIDPVKNSAQGKTREQTAKAIGTSHDTLRKVKTIAKEKPELLKDIDSGKHSVLSAFKEIKKKQRNDENKKKQEKALENISKKRLWEITEKQNVVECDVLITDPPYGIIDQPWEPGSGDIEDVTRLWATRWSYCKADFILIFWSQRFLFRGKRWFDDSLSQYKFQQLLIWHYANNKSPQSRDGFKQTWEPIFFYRKFGSEKKVGVGGSEWGKDLHDFDCHVAAVPQSNFNNEDYKQHPAQKPVSVMKWLVNATTQIGDVICDPFCGSGTTGIAATQLGRKFIGIENNKEYFDLARKRLALYGK